MPYSETDICNQALYKLGDERINTLTESTRRAQLCLQLYPICRDALLRLAAPKFARRRASLGVLDPAPAWGYSYRYQLPVDPYSLQVLELNGDDTERWEIEGRELLTNESTAHIRYTALITDTGHFDPLFTDTLAEFLASELAYAITGSHTTKQHHLALFKDKLAECRHQNGREGSPQQIPLSGLFTDVR